MRCLNVGKLAAWISQALAARCAQHTGTFTQVKVKSSKCKPLVTQRSHALTFQSSSKLYARHFGDSTGLGSGANAHPAILKTKQSLPQTAPRLLRPHPSVTQGHTDFVAPHSLSLLEHIFPKKGQQRRSFL